jgi:hypothetical protein
MFNFAVPLVRERYSRVLLGFLPILGKGYTQEEVDSSTFKERQFQILQEGLQLVCIVDVSQTSTGRL